MVKEDAQEDKDGPRLSPMDRVYGAIGVAAVLLALFFLVRGGAGGGEAAPADRPPPRLVLIEPRAGAELAQPVAVTFDAGTPLATDGSDPAAGRHVHVRAGPSELMATAGDVRPLGGTRYRWTLPPLPAGTHALSLYWSDAYHRPLPAGASDSVVVHVR